MTHVAPARSTAVLVRRRIVGTLVAIGRWTVVVVMGILTALIVTLAIAATADVRQPVQWGTFTELTCVEQGRTSCDPVGTWVSDDGHTILRDVSLDGPAPGIGQRARAGYRNKGLLGGDSGVVHTKTLLKAAPLISWAIAGMFIFQFLRLTGLSNSLRRRYGRKRRERRAQPE